VGALANLGHPMSDQTVGNMLRRRGIAPVPGEEPNDHLEGLYFAGTWTFSPAPTSSVDEAGQVDKRQGSGRYRVIRTSNSIVFHLQGGTCDFSHQGGLNAA